MQSLYTAASGLSSQQKRIDIAADNIANSNTAGFKSSRADFKDALYTAMEVPAPASGAGNNLQLGSGVALDATSLDFSEGTVAETGAPFDFAVEGKGFFQVMAPDGEILYTRSGSFKPSVIGGEAYLVTGEGYFVLDNSGGRVRLSADGKDLESQPGLVSFPNPAGLSRAGGSCYRATASSGQPEADQDSKIVCGALEGSNVDMARELTSLIRAQRAYSLASRALSTADDMLGLANNMH